MLWGFEQFVQRWLKKAEEYDGSDLSDAFDKFITLYIVFNILYEEAFSRIKEKEEISRKDSAERMRAVKHVANFLGHDEISRRIQSCSKALSSIIEILEVPKYYFNVKRGSRDPDWEKDAQKLQDIQSGDSTRLSKAILNLEYRTRCNLFHGAKSYDEGQKDVIGPMTVILSEIIEVALEKFEIQRLNSS